jgi:hypothetical protein
VAALPVIVIALSATLLLCCEAISGKAVIAWSRFPTRIQPLLPLLLVLFCVYWIVHLADAVRHVKPELIDLRNPIARLICERFSDSKR